jgi:beta-N-acetylhexosaminidase
VSLGPIMIDLRGPSLESDERQLLLNPHVGGIILFSRNYESPSQIIKLCDEVHALRKPPLLIAVDHEGGRVQRFRESFTALPPCSCFGDSYDEDSIRGLELAEEAGWLMAIELRSVGVDFSFAPVLDIDKGISNVIGERAFHRKPDGVTALARNYIHGMNAAGMSAVGKHFPGHGGVKEDSHMETPVDKRKFEDLYMDDLIPFERLINGGLAAIMPAHVIYPEIDDKPAGFSRKWIYEILRIQFSFEGVIFSDDICMDGAGVVGGYLERARAALNAGCDMILVCNNQDAAKSIIEKLEYSFNPASQARLMRMHGRGTPPDFEDLKRDEKWKFVSAKISKLIKEPELNLGDDRI